ncbi:MAG: NUDIX hydrolase [Chlamydiales bacterium]|nr:NUDIX hydrolase [Chlamydiales bacterium]
MKTLFLFSLFCLQCIYGNQPFEEYFSYIQQQPNGNYQEGEIEIIRDPVEIAQIQKIQENRLLQKGFSQTEAMKFSQIGVVCEDQYLIWLRDAVYFPQKIPGTYDRIFWKNAQKKSLSGVAVLPIFPSGRIALIATYRHATRSWELEIPRGGVYLQETAEEAALRELQEETGLVASSLHFLGQVAPDSGILSSIIPIFLAKISSQENSHPEYSEAIAKVVSFTEDEWKKGLIQGFLEVSIKGEQKSIPLRDPFLTFALLQAKFRKLL